MVFHPQQLLKKIILSLPKRSIIIFSVYRSCQGAILNRKVIYSFRYVGIARSHKHDIIFCSLCVRCVFPTVLFFINFQTLSANTARYKSSSRGTELFTAYCVTMFRWNLNYTSLHLSHPMDITISFNSIKVTCECNKELIDATHLFRHFLHSNESICITKAPRM